jgi:hypothetical protein
MPWGSVQASEHTKAATTPKKKRQWSAVANKMLKGGASDAEAIMAANAAVKGKRRKR